MPQEDYAEAIYPSLLSWVLGQSDEWSSGKMSKMSGKGQ